LRQAVFPSGLSLQIKPLISGTEFINLLMAQQLHVKAWPNFQFHNPIQGRIGGYKAEYLQTAQHKHIIKAHRVGLKAKNVMFEWAGTVGVLGRPASVTTRATQWWHTYKSCNISSIMYAFTLIVPRFYPRND
jgi:hypothetical protein